MGAIGNFLDAPPANDSQPLRISGSGALRVLQMILSDLHVDIAERERDEKYMELLLKYNKLSTLRDNLKQNLGVFEARQGGVALPCPYVVAFVDAHSHRFKEHWLRAGHYGGAYIADKLHKAISTHMIQAHPDLHSCHIFVRAYGSIKLLAEELTAQKGSSRPSASRRVLGALSSYTAGFSRELPLFNFINTANEAAVETKIIKNFKICVQDPLCQLVFFAAGGSTLYANVLQEYAESAQKILIIKRGSEDRSLSLSGFGFAIFSEVFDDIRQEVTGADPLIDLYSDFSNNKSTQNGSTETFHKPVELPAQTLDHGLEESCTKAPPAQPSQQASLQSPSMTVSLPRPLTATRSIPSLVVPDFILVNAKGHRLDSQTDVPTVAQRGSYYARMVTGRPCLFFHLTQSCKYLRGCSLDHNPIDDNTRYYLKYWIRLSPWFSRGACRQVDCIYGHICQKPECARAKAKNCPYGMEAHRAAWISNEWVKPKESTNPNERTPKNPNIQAAINTQPGPIVNGVNSQGWNNRHRPNTKGTMETWTTAYGALFEF